MQIHILPSEEKNTHNKDNTKETEDIFARILAEMERQGQKYAELTGFLDLLQRTFSSWKAGRSRNYCEHLGVSIPLKKTTETGQIDHLLR